jgi:ribosomal protein S10
MTDDERFEKELDPNDSLHQQLVQAYLDYFVSMENWEAMKTHRRYYDLQQRLRKIKKITNQRNIEVKVQFREVRPEVFKSKPKQ